MSEDVDEDWWQGVKDRLAQWEANGRPDAPALYQAGDLVTCPGYGNDVYLVDGMRAHNYLTDAAPMKGQ